MPVVPTDLENFITSIMKYFIDKDGEKFICFYNLHNKENSLTIEYNSSNNSVLRSCKYGMISNPSGAEMVTFQKTENYLSEIKFITDYLNNCPELDEKFLTYVLLNRCSFHILSYNRIIDLDLAVYADAVLLIYEAWDQTLSLEDGIKLRTLIIKETIKKYAKQLYITTYSITSLNSELVPYEIDSKNYGVLLGII